MLTAWCREDVVVQEECGSQGGLRWSVLTAAKLTRSLSEAELRLGLQCRHEWSFDDDLTRAHCEHCGTAAMVESVERRGVVESKALPGATIDLAGATGCVWSGRGCATSVSYNPETKIYLTTWTNGWQVRKT